MVGAVTSSEEAQLLQTIEMFEVITQSQPQDFQSLEILKEAYAKLGRQQDVITTSKRIAQVYVTLGQLSSAILEYESVLQLNPEDADVLAALNQLEAGASSLGRTAITVEAPDGQRRKAQPGKDKPQVAPVALPPPAPLEDGRKEMFRIFVEGKVLPAEHFDQCWVKPDLSRPPKKPVEPFIQVLENQGLSKVEHSLRLLSDRTRLGYVPLDRYDLDMELARKWPPNICLQWCVLPFDRMSKSVLVATCNPFNRQAAAEIEQVARQRVIWYLADPQPIMQALQKLYR
jgi:tetratricopeptide (TPR) repeat protein